jgi:predicted component of type VI protein secretion system
MPPPIDPSIEEVLILHMLDPNQGFPVQTWTFTSRPEVRIGRATDNEVVIPHPYVSRYHVQLRWREGGWELVSTGSHGTLVKGERVKSVRLTEGDEFRLGPQGPMLRFHCESLSDASSGTLAGALMTLPAIAIDTVKKEQEVQVVAESDYFQKLQERVQALRARRI